MALIRAKTDDLINLGEVSPQRRLNSRTNEAEMRRGAARLTARPRRLVLELTNACNISCVMCGRNAADFTPTVFDMAWLDFFDPILDQVEEVTLMGWGEPTLHPRFTDLLRFFSERGLRKYFCTNGTRLAALEDAIFETGVEIMAVSLDGADPAAGDAIRRGANWAGIVESLKSVAARKKALGTPFPYVNLVFTAMADNFRQIPAMVELTAELGLEELKVVYLTAFDETFSRRVLYGRRAEVEEVFQDAEARADRLGLRLKLPHLEGQDPAGTAAHKPCFTLWRDFFLGSDGYVRACMSTGDQLFHISRHADFEAAWNSPEFQYARAAVNSEKLMPEACRRCYQSSYANWNQPHAFIQAGEKFAPTWAR